MARNAVIAALEKKLAEMKKMTPAGFADASQAAAYFAEKEVILEDIVKAVADVSDAGTTETEGVKEAVKEFREVLKRMGSAAREIGRKEIEAELGKALCAAWSGNAAALGELKCTPNLRNENWNNPADFEWSAEKGFSVKRKEALGEPMGNMATNDQYLINPIYEDVIMTDARRQSVMMDLVKHRPMMGPSIFIPERDRGSVKLNWLTSYGQQIEGTKPKGARRVELKAYTLAGYIPWYDEFEEDVFADLGRIFIEEFTDAYAAEFDRQCLVAKNEPFTGVMAVDGVKSFTISAANAAGVSYLDFRNAELLVNAEERKNCAWFLHETVLNHITNVKDAEDRPLWRAPQDEKPGRIDNYPYHECSVLPQLVDVGKSSPFAVFMNPKRILCGNRKGIEIKRFDATTESLEYGELFMRFRKRSGFLVTRAANNIVVLRTSA